MVRPEDEVRPLLTALVENIFIKAAENPPVEPQSVAMFRGPLINALRRPGSRLDVDAVISSQFSQEEETFTISQVVSRLLACQVGKTRSRAKVSSLML
jgi:hypothetical protein